MSGKDGNWYTQVRDESRKEKRRKIVKTTLEKLQAELWDHYTGKAERERLDRITIEALYPKWLEYKRLHTEASTYITRLESDWKKYYEDTQITQIPVTRLSKIMLDEWIHTLIRDRHLSKKQYTNMITIVKQVLDYAVDLGILEMNPYDLVKVDGRRLFTPVRKKDSNTQVYSTSELLELSKLAWRDYEEKVKDYELSPLAVLFQFETGLRIGELCVVRYEDIHRDRIHVQRMYRRDTKEVVPHTKGSAGDRDVILTSDARFLIETCRNRQKELGIPCDGFIFSIDGKPCSYYAISDLYRKYCKRLGIPMKSSHKARKTFISALIDSNMNINSVREMAGHVDEHTTYANYCYDRSNDEERVAKMENALSYTRAYPNLPRHLE